MSESSPERSTGATPSRGVDPEVCQVREPDAIRCPVCGGQGVEKKQKWFCARCGQLLQTCCD